MNVRLLPRYTWRWWFLDWGFGRQHRIPRVRLVQRNTLHPSRQYAQGVKWSVRCGPVVLTRYLDCTCR